MDLTISRPVKILALVGVLVGVAGAGSLTLLGHKGASAGAPLPSVAQLRARHRAQEHAAAPAAAKPATKPARHVAKPAPAASKPAVHHAAKPARPRPAHPQATSQPQPVQPSADTLVDSSGLPLVLADELRAHRIVVVAIFDPQSETDAVTYAEAQAGAAEAGAGFLGVSVLDNDVAGPLTALLPGGGLLPDPGVLVYRAPGALVERLDGFQDRDAVAQAAVAALTDTPVGTGAPAATTTTATP